MKTKHQSVASMLVTQSGEQTQNNPIHRKWSALALGGFFFTSIFALSAPPVEAQCMQYDVSGQYNIRQGRANFPIALSQNGKTVSGTTYRTTPDDDDGNNRNVHGRVTGTVEGNSFDVQINWADGGAAVYRGTIDKTGLLRGTSYDKNKPSTIYKWDVNHTFECAPTPVPPTNPTPRPLKSTGKEKPAGVGFRQLRTPTPAPAASAEAEESASTDTEDQHKKKKKKNKNKNKKKHHHHDDYQNQGND